MKKSRTKKTAKPRVPEGMLIYAIGDIHGQLHLLNALLKKVSSDAKKIKTRKKVLVFVGDYVDRGPDSAGVINRLVTGLPKGFEVNFLKGNHEAILLKFLKHPEIIEHWEMNGAGATLASYGIDITDRKSTSGEQETCRDGLLSAMPRAHLAFFKKLSLSASYGDYLFVHAGIRPGVRLKDQSEQDMLWIRKDFLECDDDLGAVVVHGHTPRAEPVVRSNRIGIDTGAWVNGRLTALRLFGTDRSFLTAKE